MGAGEAKDKAQRGRSLANGRRQQAIDDRELEGEGKGVRAAGNLKRLLGRSTRRSGGGRR